MEFGLSMQLIKNPLNTRAKACKNDVKHCSNALTNEHQCVFQKKKKPTWFIGQGYFIKHRSASIAVYSREDCVKLQGALMVGGFFF